jgi:glycosyltransferase involved in cell wall biosynthesis
MGRLEGFYTSSYVEQSWLQNFFLKSGNKFFSRRFLEGLSAPFVHSHWSFEIREFLMRKLQGKSAAVQNLVYRRDMDFDAMMARLMPSITSGYFWGFQGSCHDSLIAARIEGKMAICELATAHVVQAKKILGEEAALHKEWADSIDNLFFPGHYEKRLENEPIVADKVIAASAFTRWTLLESGIEASKIEILPLGFEAEKIPHSLEHKNLENRKLKVLFAGTVTQRKGMSYLLDAMEKLNRADIELHVYGGIQGSGGGFEKRKHLLHYHPPVSQYELFQLYTQFDVLVLPTIFEGFGLVIVEAMAAGLPVITTAHSMGPDVIENEKSGWIIPIRDAGAIATALEKLRQKSNAEYAAMRSEARNAALRYSWDRYRAALIQCLDRL